MEYLAILQKIDSVLDQLGSRGEWTNMTVDEAIDFILDIRNVASEVFSE